MRNDKIVIYQLFPRLFGNFTESQVPWGTRTENGCGKFNDISDKALEGLLELGISHIWLTGIIRHATGSDYPDHNLRKSNPSILKGMAGSPYAISDYYDVDPDLASNVPNRMKEFESLLDRIHKHGIKVIIDFIPNHVSRDYHSSSKPSHIKDLGEGDNISLAFSPNNNFYYLPGEALSLPENIDNEVFMEKPAKATGNDVFSSTPSSNDWYETVKLNYGIQYPEMNKHFDPIPDTWYKMKEILQFWSAKGVDGFRCDMAGMVPVEFWSFAISKAKEEYPEMLFIAEIYEPENYYEFIAAAGFDFLYDKVGLYDTLRDIITGYSNTDNISRVWKGLEGLDNYMLRFMENHDEQRLASIYFVENPLKGLPAMALCSMMNNGPVMIYNGQEVGEKALGSSGYSGNDGRTSIFDYSSMPEIQKWANKGKFDGGSLSHDIRFLRDKYSQLLLFCTQQAEIDGQFYDLMWQNQDLEPRIKNRVYAFLRYIQNSVLLIAVSFDNEIKATRIRIPTHALEMAEMHEKERFNILELNPGNQSYNLMLSQINGSGVPVSFDKTGWTAIRLS